MIFGKVKDILGSGWLMVVLIVVYAVGLGVATFVEDALGTRSAMELIYKAWWFFALQGLMVVNFVAMAARLKLYKARKWGVLLLHYGLVMILVGAMVTYLTGVEGIVHIRQGESSRQVVDASGKMLVAQLPFEIKLEEFSLTRYGDSGSPSSFVSRVTIEGHSDNISLNNVLYYGAWRFYQTSYDPDERGTFLTASRDVAGVVVTYIGYLMLCVGLIWVLVGRKSRFARLLASIGVLSAFCVQVASADMVSDKFERLLVQQPSGRVVSVGSYAEDLLRKIAGQKSYKGLSASEVLLGITTDPARWATEEIVKGADGKRIAFADVIGANGEYLLGEQVEKIYQKAPRERTKADKELIKLDERINIFDNLLSGKMFAIFPRQGSAKWYSVADNLTDFASSPKDSMLVSKIYPWFASELLNGNRTRAAEVLSMIEIYQKAKAGEQYNPRRIEAELIYSKLDIFKWSSFALMTLGLLLSIVMVITTVGAGRLLRYVFMAMVILTAAVFLFQTFGLGLRWYISGRAPWTNAYETMVYVSWAAVLAGFLFFCKSKLTFALSVFLGGVLLFVSTLSWLDPQITPLAPVLDSYWLIIHVAVITASYAFFAIGSLLGVASMILLSTKQTPIKKLKIKEISSINTLSLTVGLTLMTIGTFLGAVWANESWGRYWGWDPKETWALITVLVYAFVVHSYMIRRLDRPYFMALFSILAFLTVLMTFFGVNYFFSGMHSYGSDSAPEALGLVYWIYGVLFALSIVPLVKGNHRF